MSTKLGKTILKTLRTIILMNLVLIISLFLVSSANQARENCTSTYQAQPRYNSTLIKRAYIPKNANIIWLGETHGTARTSEVALDLIKRISSQVNLDYLIIEGSYYTEILLNQYLSDGQETSLNELMSSYRGTVAYTEQNKDYYRAVYHYNQSLPKEKRVRAISIDIEHSPQLAHQYIFREYSKLTKVHSKLLIHSITKELTSDQVNTVYTEVRRDIEANR